MILGERPFEEKSADEREAQHLRYFAQHIMRLSSGQFALYSMFTNEVGLKCVAIGTLAELEPFIVVPSPQTYQTRTIVERPVRPLPAAFDDLELDLDL